MSVTTGRDQMHEIAQTPIVSVIMPCYNSAPHLDGSISSVRRQTWRDWELVVVDDGSNDESWSKLTTLSATETRFTIVRQENAGAAAARNRGLRAARGRYIAFLDSDDTWDPNFLEVMIAALESNRDAGIAYCGWQNIGLPGSRGAPFVPPDYETPDKLVALLEGCRWPIHGALTRAALILDCGGFDEGLSSCMDYDLWLRLGTSHRLQRVPRVLAYYHHHGGVQITNNPVRVALNHLRVQQKFLRNHPDLRKSIGVRRIRELTFGELLRRGYSAYWQRDLSVARSIFRKVMKGGYGRPKDWLYMLPCLLPLCAHARLLRYLDAHRV